MNGAYGLAFDTSGNLYVANQYGNSITRFDSTGHGSIFASSGMNQPTGLAYNNGYLYVANAGSNKILKFDSAGNGTVFASGTGLNNPEGIAFDSSGNLYAVNYNSTRTETPRCSPAPDCRPRVLCHAGSRTGHVRHGCSGLGALVARRKLVR
jgi:DNA-binding beta-propeller fold protein YncE